MTQFNLTALSQPEQPIADPLTDLLRRGARDLIAQAVESELQLLLDEHSQRRLPDGRQTVVRNGYLPERTVQTGIGDVEVKVPKVRDRSGSGVCFNSSLLPPYLKRAKSIEQLLPWLHLKGISTGDGALVRFETKYPGTMSRLRKDRDELLALVVNNVKFKDAEQVEDQSDRNAA